jgi:hypothetical protein
MHQMHLIRRKSQEDVDALELLFELSKVKIRLSMFFLYGETYAAFLSYLPQFVKLQGREY